MTTIGLTCLSSVGFYIPFVWLPTWLSQIISHKLPKEQAFASSTIALSALLILMPPLALLSDRVGRRPMYLASAAGYILLSYPLMVLMQGGTFLGAVVGCLAFAVVNSLFGCCMGATMVELFPTRIRSRAVGFTFSWSRVSSIFIGYWVADLLAHFGPTGVFALIGIAMGSIILSIGLFGPRTNGRSLEVLSP